MYYPITVLVIFISIAIAILYFIISASLKEKTITNTVPIQTYDEVVNQLHYTQLVSYTKDIIIQDLLINGEIDTSFINKLAIHLSVNKKLDNSDIEKHKTIILNDIDSIYDKWLMSIPFMFGDDSIKVMNSDSYKKILELIKN